MIYDLSNLPLCQLVGELKKRAGVQVVPCYELEENYNVTIKSSSNSGFEVCYKDNGPAVILIVTD